MQGIDTANLMLAHKACRKSDHCCGQCGKDIVPYSNLALFQFVGLGRDAQGRTALTPVIETTGEYRWYPYYFHSNCMEEIIGIVREYNKDTPPFQAKSPENIAAECDLCGSHLLVSENTATVHWVQLGISARAPNKESALELAVTHQWDPMFVCMDCVADMTQHALMEGNLWADELDDGLGVLREYGHG